MTVTTTDVATSFDADGEAYYDVTWKVRADESDIVVTLDGETKTGGGTDYSVSFLGSPAGSSGARVTPISSWTGTLRISRRTTGLQETNLQTAQRLGPEVVEQALDLDAMRAQELRDELGRSLRLAPGETLNPLEATAAARAGKTVLFSDDGLTLETGPSSNEISNAQTHATNAANSATAAAASASAAATSAANAATSETNAAASSAAALAALSGSGWRFAFDDATADADPGAGEFRLNHATPASATAIYIDNVDADGSDLSSLFDAWDDYGQSARRGFVRINGVDQPAAFLVGLMTGSTVDGTGYRKLTISVLAAGGTFSASDDFLISFSPAGADGEGFTNGDKGDVTLAGSPAGSSITINARAVTYAKLQAVSTTARLMGRATAGAGDMEELTAAQVAGILFDPSGFGGNLAPSDTTFQAVLDKLDALSVSGGWTYLTPFTATSGSSHDFTIPGGAEDIELTFIGTSVSGSDNYLVQLGDSGGIETSNYFGGSLWQAGDVNDSTGFLVYSAIASGLHYVRFSLTRATSDGTGWSAMHGGERESSTVIAGGGYKALSAALTTVRATVTGANTYDAGLIACKWK